MNGKGILGLSLCVQCPSCGYFAGVHAMPQDAAVTWVCPGCRAVCEKRWDELFCLEDNHERQGQ